MLWDWTPGHPGCDEHHLHCGRKPKLAETSIRVQQVQICECSAVGEQICYMYRACTYIIDVIELDSAGVPSVQCSIISIRCKTGVILVHSENDGANQQAHCCAHLDPYCT